MNRILTNILVLYVLIQSTQTLRTYTKEDMIKFR